MDSGPCTTLPKQLRHDRVKLDEAYAAMTTEEPSPLQTGTKRQRSSHHEQYATRKPETEAAVHGRSPSRQKQVKQQPPEAQNEPNEVISQKLQLFISSSPDVRGSWKDQVSTCDAGEQGKRPQRHLQVEIREIQQTSP